MLEAVCYKCGDTFNPEDDNDLEHGVRTSDDEHQGEPCGGRGVIVGSWHATRAEALEAFRFSAEDEASIARRIREVFAGWHRPTQSAEVVDALERVGAHAIGCSVDDLRAVERRWIVREIRELVEPAPVERPRDELEAAAWEAADRPGMGARGGRND